MMLLMTHQPHLHQPGGWIGVIHSLSQRLPKAPAGRAYAASHPADACMVEVHGRAPCMLFMLERHLSSIGLPSSLWRHLVTLQLPNLLRAHETVYQPMRLVMSVTLHMQNQVNRHKAHKSQQLWDHMTNT